MRFLTSFSCLFAFLMLFSIPAGAVALLEGKKQEDIQAKDILVPHKALYDINLVATRSGSQIVNISGKMFYEWKPSCDAWITDHRFNLFYEYADSPGVWITSDFSTFETFDGQTFNFSARRNRNKNLYEELRGQATVADKGGEAVYTIPENMNFELAKGAMFPMTHTVEMVRKAKSNKKFFSAVVFDGSDDEGPVQINTFIGSPVNAMQVLEASDKIDMSLLNTPAWNVRMAVFPTMKDEETSDYEMSMIFHENGIISDMLIEYDNFSVTQKLVALEKLDGEKCGDSEKSTKAKDEGSPDKKTGKNEKKD